MISLRSKGAWVALTILFLLLLTASYYGFRIMTSVYKTDMGNGVVIYADDFVKSGEWIFDCKYSRLISRRPIPVPLAELENAGKLTIGNGYLSEGDEVPAKEALKALTSTPKWYDGLRYRYSGLDESSNLRSHSYGLVFKNQDRLWAVMVSQWVGYDGQSTFRITPVSYDPDTYVDHAKAIQQARNSCPASQ